MKKMIQRSGIILICLLLGASLALGLINLFPEDFMKVPAHFQAPLFLLLVLVFFYLTLRAGTTTWKRFMALPELPRMVWGVIAVLMAPQWLLNQIGPLTPERLPLLIPRGYPQLAAAAFTIDLALLFFGCGVWLIALLILHSQRGIRLETISQKITPVHIGLLFGAFVLFSLVVNPGVFHPEMYTYMPAHISGKPILEIIFDIKTMNLGLWESRQLSYLIDVIDGNFVAWCIRLGIPHFRSITFYVFSLIAVGYLWVSFTREMKADRLLSLLAIALLLFSPSFIYTLYYRTSKIGVTLMMVILLCEIYRALASSIGDETRRRKPIGLLLVFFLTGLALTLFDMLGVLFAGVLTGYCLILFLFKPNRTKAAILAGLGLALTTWAVYFLWLGPAIMRAVTGQIANSAFLTQAPLQDLIPLMMTKIPALILGMMGILLGNMTKIQALFGLVLLGMGAIWLGIGSQISSAKGPLVNAQHPRKEGKNEGFGKRTYYWAVRNEPLFTLAVLIGGILVIYDFLVMRHKGILMPDVRIVYYVMPAAATLLFGIFTFLVRPGLYKKILNPNLYPVIILFLLILLVGNVVGVIGDRSVLENGHIGDYYRFAPRLLYELRLLDSPNHIPNESIINDPIYQLFVKSKPVSINP
jgi:hypothetical protein